MVIDIKTFLFIVISSSTSYITVLSNVAEVPAISPSHFKCARMKNRTCGHEVGHTILRGVGIEKIDSNCCGELIHMGKRCSDLIVETRIAHDKAFEKNRTQVFESSTKVWNKCGLIAQSLPEVISCKSKFSQACGVQVGNKVKLNKGGISVKCCDELLKAGRDCNELLALASAALPNYQAQSDDIVERSNDAWIDCVNESKK